MRWSTRILVMLAALLLFILPAVAEEGGTLLTDESYEMPEYPLPVVAEEESIPLVSGNDSPEGDELPTLDVWDGNLLVNGSFETLDLSGLPAGWYTDAYMPNKRISSIEMELQLRSDGKLAQLLTDARAHVQEAETPSAGLTETAQLTAWLAENSVPGRFSAPGEISSYGVTAEAHDGNVAVWIENHAANDARFAQMVTVEPNTVYVLSGWVRSEGVPDMGRGANVSVLGVYSFSEESVYDPADGWQYLVLYGCTGPEQTTLTVAARLGGYSDGESTGRAVFDDLRLVKADVIPEGVKVDNWYSETVSVPAGQQTTTTDETASPFWPWLLFLSVVYGGAAFLIGRWNAFRVKPELHRQVDGRDAGLLTPLMIAAVLLRVFIATQVEGYQVDVGCFTTWGSNVLSSGVSGFYNTGFCDYPPGYLYVLGLNETLYRLFGGSAALWHKLVPMTCDIVSAWLVYRIATDNGATRKQASLAAALMAFNPAMILNSAAWCQMDSALCLLLMFVAYLAIRRRWDAALPVYVAAILVKPQALMLGFLGLAAILVEMVKDPPVIERKDGKISVIYTETWKQLGKGLLWSLVVALAVLLPHIIGMGGVSWLFELYGETLASYPYATVNTANIYYLADGNWETILANADAGVTAFFLLLSAALCVYTFMHRKEKKLTWLEPAILVTLVVGAALLALGILSGGEDHILSMGNPWYLWQEEVSPKNYEWRRDFISGVEGTWAMRISPMTLWVSGLALLAAAGGLVALLVRRLRRKAQTSICTGLVEPVLMLLFTLVFAFMLVLDTTWGSLGTVAMAWAFAVVLPIYIRRGELKLLPLCGAVLFILLYVFGVKMHERYLFPAIFLLGMDFAFRRDRRSLWLMVILSCTVFINEGIVLDNSIRLGSDYGHLLGSSYAYVNADTHVLACLVSATNVLMALWSVWLCYGVMGEGSAPRMRKGPPRPVFELEVLPEDPCTPLTLKETHHVKWGRLDWLLMGVVTLVYAIVTFTTLGSVKAPQNAFASENENDQIIIDLGEYQDDFTMLYYAQVSYRDFTVETSDDGENWTSLYWAEMAEGQCFRWKYVCPSYMSGDKRVYYGGSTLNDVIHMSGRYVRITTQRQYRYDDTASYPLSWQAQEPLIINEIIFRDENGQTIPAAVREVIYGDPTAVHDSDPAALFDEQDTLEGEPGWWNSTYFDEIYHARTAYEHVTGQEPYEWTHPPLGKIIMSWFVQLFGMTPFGWRFGGALCGVLMLPAMYCLAKQLLKKRSLAFGAMFFMAVDCMHLTQTRIATIDSYPVLFIILSYFFMLRFLQRDIVSTPMKKLIPDLALSGFFMGCGMASKWIGVYAGLGLAALYFWACLRALRVGDDAAQMKRSVRNRPRAEMAILNRRSDHVEKKLLVCCLWCLLFFVAVPIAIYLLSYTVHLQARTFTSFGDFLKAVWQVQESMLSYHSIPGLGMDHPGYTPWYEWFTMQNPMYYAAPAFHEAGWTSAIFCFGNPIVWYVGAAGVAYAIYRWAAGHRYGLKGQYGSWHLYSRSWSIVPAFIITSMAAQLLPWVLVPRGTYIYHYFASIPFLILGGMLLLDRLCGHFKSRWPLWTALGLALALFIVLFPYASGVECPQWWKTFVSSYPWIDPVAAAEPGSLANYVKRLLEAIPLLPSVY